MTDNDIIRLYFARSILSSEQDAEECVSDAYLKVWNSIPPDEPVSLKAYMATDEDALVRLLEEALAVYGVSFEGYETVNARTIIHTEIIWSNLIGKLKDPRFTRAVIDPEGKITVRMDLPRVELIITEDDIPTDAAIVAMAEEMANQSAHAEHGPVDALYVEEKHLLYREGQFWIDAYVFVNKTVVDELDGKSYYAGTAIRYFIPLGTGENVTQVKLVMFGR